MVAIVVLIIHYRTEWRPNFDIRWLALGALLPDLIDKTVGLFILKDYIDNGRIFAHTLLFSIVLTMLAYHLRNRVSISISFGAWTHLAFDKMWEVPETLFWPGFGFGFPATDFYPGRWIEMLYTDPYIYSTEILGAGILFSLFIYWKLYKRDNWRKFWSSGRIPLI
jgi:hypothetical protein